MKDLEALHSDVCDVVEQNDVEGTVRKVTAKRRKKSLNVGGDGNTYVEGEEIVLVPVLPHGTTVRDSDDLPELPDEFLNDMAELAVGPWTFYDLSEGATGCVEIHRDTEVPLNPEGVVETEEYI